ncbi:phytoene desaturase family protein [Methanosalsum natronophilum]|uniref:phytoene desaturase family protein n=1 Tax=Methanosalsum natronophilum TaxID=768733 RepID=UPI002166DBF7|nr:phytoene desaturase family protein [Methanosalsum natronophilum]MCS3924589.1 phytoene desaturase [Methanosalsum natronophilum]
MKIIVIGAGFGGLSAASLFSRDGHQVTVIEKNELPGGRASVYSENDFNFDMGPSWYLMPDIYENYFAEFGKKPEDYYELKKLDPSYRVFFGDKKVVDISPSLEKNYELFDTFEENGGEKLKNYLESAGEMYESSVKEMLYKDFTSVSDFLSGKLLFKGMKLNILESLDHFVNKRFDSDEARKVLEYSIGFLGSSPQKTPSMYHIMSHIDMTMGVFYPEGGMRKVVSSMYDLAVEQGVDFKFNEPVKSLEIQEKKVNKVITSNGEYDCDMVLVNADYAHSEIDLIPDKHQSYSNKYWETRVMAPSAFVAYVGIDKVLDKLDHHNLFLQEDWSNKFDKLFDPKKAEWPDSPSYYVNIPSRTDSTASPEGTDTLFILVPLAPGLEDTEEKREELYNMIMNDLEEKVNEDIRGHVVVKRIFALDDFKRSYNAYKGTALGISHTLRQTAVWRPAHKSKKVSNLFYSGQYTHPGIGVPMTLISSQIVAEQINGNNGDNK